MSTAPFDSNLADNGNNQNKDSSSRSYTTGLYDYDDNDYEKETTKMLNAMSEEHLLKLEDVVLEIQNKAKNQENLYGNVIKEKTPQKAAETECVNNPEKYEIKEESTSPSTSDNKKNSTSFLRKGKKLKFIQKFIKN